MSSNDELSSDTSCSCDAESLQLVVEGEGSFNSIIIEGDVTEEDEDDEDGICFVTLKSWFENKETVLTHWLLELFAKSAFFDILVIFRLDLGQITFDPVENGFAIIQQRAFLATSIAF